MIGLYFGLYCIFLCLICYYHGKECEVVGITMTTGNREGYKLYNWKLWFYEIVFTLSFPAFLFGLFFFVVLFFVTGPLLDWFTENFFWML